MDPSQYVNWESSFDGNLSDYNQQQGTNYATSQEAMAGWNYAFNYATQQREHILAIHDATEQAADIIMQTAMIIAPVPKIGLLRPLLNRGTGYLGGAYFRTVYTIAGKNSVRLHSGLTRYGTNNTLDIAHRSATFFRHELLSTPFRVKNWNTIYFNTTIGNRTFSTGVNPWTRRIFHEGPGIFK